MLRCGKEALTGDLVLGFLSKTGLTSFLVWLCSLIPGSGSGSDPDSKDSLAFLFGLVEYVGKSAPLMCNSSPLYLWVALLP
jgi:hypothetical protein